MDCRICGAWTWACVKSPHGALCLSCALDVRLGRAAKPTHAKPPKPCICRHDEACDVCYAAKDAAFQKVRA